MGSIKVSLTIGATPALTVDPLNHHVSARNDTIKWKESATSPTKGFTFTALTGLPNPPFKQQKVDANEISVDDDNTSANVYPYTLTVTYNGQSYSTSAQIGGNPGDPTINNK